MIGLLFFLSFSADVSTKAYSSPENKDLSIRFAVARPYGTYDKVYHKLAHICTNNNNTNTPIFGNAGNGMKQTTIDVPNVDK